MTLKDYIREKIYTKWFRMFDGPKVKKPEEKPSVEEKPKSESETVSPGFNDQ